MNDAFPKIDYVNNSFAWPQPVAPRPRPVLVVDNTKKPITTPHGK